MGGFLIGLFFVFLMRLCFIVLEKFDVVDVIGVLFLELILFFVVYFVVDLLGFLVIIVVVVVGVM